MTEILHSVFSIDCLKVERRSALHRGSIGLTACDLSQPGRFSSGPSGLNEEAGSEPWWKPGGLTTLVANTLSVMSYDRKSKDLNIRGLTNHWIKSYLLGLDAEQLAEMRRAFERRLRLLIPICSRPWGFKNPRAMFVLPFYHEMFPELRFIHVIRDGRDMCFGNPFVDSPTLWSFVSEDESARLSKEELMIKFWGESNRRVRQYGETTLKNRYLLNRFEDLCNYPEAKTRRILDFIDGPIERLSEIAGLVRKP